MISNKWECESRVVTHQLIPLDVDLNVAVKDFIFVINLLRVEILFKSHIIN